MTGLDTNVLLRATVADDPIQTQTVTQFFSTLTVDTPGYISLVCLAEFVWVLRRRYGYPKDAVIQAIQLFLETPEFVFENLPAVEQALQSFTTSNAGFADCLIERACRVAGCSDTVTFDKGAAKAAGMRLL